MPTHAQLAAKLLNDAAAFFRTLGKENPPLEDQMEENATVFVQVADLAEQYPTQVFRDPTAPDETARTHAQLAAKLLNDAAAFFRTLGKENSPLEDQMEENATVFDQVAELVEHFPTQELQDPEEMDDKANGGPSIVQENVTNVPTDAVETTSQQARAKTPPNPDDQSAKPKVSTQRPHPDRNPLSQHNVRLNAHRDFIDPPFGLSFPIASNPLPTKLVRSNTKAVYERDNYICRYCGFRSLKYQQPVGPCDSVTNSQAHCSCIMCAQVMMLDKVAEMRSGALVYLPEIRQAELHVFARLIYVCRISQGRAAELAKAALYKLMDRRHEARVKFGTDDPFELAKQLAQCATWTDYNALLEKVRGIRLFPLDRRIIKEGDLEFNQFPQILAYWRSKDGPFGGLRPAQMDLTEFQSRVEAVVGRLSIDA